MLVLTKLSRDLIIWHLFYNKDRNCILQLDNRISHCTTIAISDIERSQDILRWSSEARFYANTEKNTNGREANSEFNLLTRLFFKGSGCQFHN